MPAVLCNNFEIFLFLYGIVAQAAFDNPIWFCHKIKQKSNRWKWNSSVCDNSLFPFNKKSKNIFFSRIRWLVYGSGQQEDEAVVSTAALEMNILLFTSKRWTLKHRQKRLAPQCSSSNVENIFTFFLFISFCIWTHFLCFRLAWLIAGPGFAAWLLGLNGSFVRGGGAFVSHDVLLSYVVSCLFKLNTTDIHFTSTTSTTTNQPVLSPLFDYPT